MKHCGQLIENILEERQIKKKDLAKGIGVPPQRIAKMLLERTLDSQLLEDICRYLKMDPAEFFDYRPGFDNYISINIDSNGVSYSKVAALDLQLINRLLATYDSRIEVYKTQIRALENTVSVLRSLLSDKININSIG